MDSRQDDPFADLTPAQREVYMRGLDDLEQRMIAKGHDPNNLPGNPVGPHHSPRRHPKEVRKLLQTMGLCACLFMFAGCKVTARAVSKPWRMAYTIEQLQERLAIVENQLSIYMEEPELDN